MLLVIGWTKAFLAAVVLKYTLLACCIYLGEAFIRSRLFKKSNYFCLMVQLWVRTHRMTRDMLASAIILLGLAPAVAFNYFNEYMSPGFVFHQLLVYRDPGQSWTE